MKEIAKKMHGAQAQLMQRTSILMLMGNKGFVGTDMYPTIGVFKFRFGDIVNIRFDEEHPFSQDEVDLAICALDSAIEETFKAAQHTIEVVKAWRGE
jgi:hypothetical protein